MLYIRKSFSKKLQVFQKRFFTFCGFSLFCIHLKCMWITTETGITADRKLKGIIDKDIYLQVQKLWEKNKRDRSLQGRKRIGKFTGTLLCGCCGSIMNYAQTQGKPKYSCNPSKTKTSKVCPGGHKQIREEDVEDVLFQSVCDVLSEPSFWFDKIHEVQNP